MEQTTAKLPIKRIVFSVLTGVFSLFFLTFILAVVVSNELVSVQLGHSLVYLVVFLSGFVAALSFKSDTKKLYYICAIEVFIATILLTAGTLLNQYIFSYNNAIFILIILLLSGIISGVISSLK